MILSGQQGDLILCQVYIYILTEKQERVKETEIGNKEEMIAKPPSTELITRLVGLLVTRSSPIFLYAPYNL